MKKKGKLKSAPIFLVKGVIRFTNFLRKLRTKILPPQVVLMEYSMEYIVMQRCVFVAAELMLGNLLEDGPKPVAQLAKESGVNCDALYRVMRALAGIGIFRERKDKIFENTRLSKCLSYGKKGTVASLAKLTGSDWMVRVWSDLLKSIETGKSHFQREYKKSFFSWLDENWEEYRIFDEGMVNLSGLSDDFIAAAYDFSQFESLVDIGGGHGKQLTTILRGYPGLKGFLFDLKRVVEGGQIEDHIKDDLVKGRIEFINGNMFEFVPEGYCCYFLKSVLHDWPDEDVIKILTNCRKAMREDSKLLIVDMIIKGDNQLDLSKVLDVAMLILVDGKERTKDDFEDLFAKVGLKLSHIFPTASPYCIIEAVPI